MTPTYTYSHSIEADVSARAIWDAYADPGTWPLWDAGSEEVTRNGPFAAGSTGTMKVRGQDPLSYRLTKVDELREFVDETPVGDIVVRVAHRLEPQASGRLLVSYVAEIDGPADQAQEVGPIITADFPQVMASLIAFARERAR